MANNTISKHRKFYKIYGINSVFDFKQESGKNYGYYDLTKLKTTLDDRIDEHTILFVTANASDASSPNLKRKIKVFDEFVSSNEENQVNLVEYEINDCDTFIWARGGAYCFSTKGIYDITYNNNVLTVYFNNGNTKKITISATGGYSAGNNISITGSTISATGYTQTNNLFEINDNKKLYAIDVYAGSDSVHPGYKLSDIHSVIESDWYDIPVPAAAGSFDKESFDDSFDK